MSAGARRLRDRAGRPGGAALALLASLSAVGARPAPAPLGAPDEARHIGRVLPDVALRTSAGATSLSRIGSGPILLALVFSRCAGVCSPFLASLRRAQESIGGRGAGLRTVVVSFDPRDSLPDMEELANGLGLAHARDWSFGVADPADVGRLAEAVGFWFAWDGERRQFDHPALLVGVRDGRVARFLVATQVEAARLHEMVRELRGEFVAAYPMPGRVAFRCFEYDPLTGGYGLGPGFLLLLVPAGAAGLATLGLFVAGGRRRATQPSG